MQHITSAAGGAAIMALAGQPYRMIMTIPYTWEGVWPVVDRQGRLTGELVGDEDDGACEGYVLVDVRNDRLIAHDGASDAVVARRDIR